MDYEQMRFEEDSFRRLILKEYGRLCGKLQAWPAELAARLGKVPPIGLQFFIWRELTQPEYYRLYNEDRPRVEEPSWDKFQAANEGRVAQAIGGAEKWENLPGDMGRVCFFGQVSRGELDKIVGTIMEVLTDADDVIAIYKDSLCRMGGIPRFLQWRFGGEVRVDPHRDRLTPAYRLLSLICLTKGGRYDDIEILVQEDEWPFENKWTPYDQEFIHEPWDGVRIGADVYALQDVVAAFSDAVHAWLPDEVENILSQMEEPAPPDEPGEPAYIFQRKGDVWHMKYMGGIEDEHFPDSDNFEVIARLLANPDREMDGFELQGLAIGVAQEKLGTKKDGSDELIVEEASSEDDEERGRQVGHRQKTADPEAIRAVEDHNEELRQQIANARENNWRADKIEELQAELEEGEKWLRERFRPLGPPPEAVKAYRTVGTNIRRALTAIRAKMPCFAEHLEKQLNPVPNVAKWVYRPGDDTHWVTTPTT